MLRLVQSNGLQILAEMRRTIIMAPEDCQAQVEQLSQQLAQLARSTRAAGMSTYCSITLHLLEQLRPVGRSPFMSPRMRLAVLRWIHLSIRYLQQPQNWRNAAALIDLWCDRQWERPISKEHREVLLGGLHTESELLVA